MATATLTLGSQNRWLADGSTTIWNFNFVGGYLASDTVLAYSFLTDEAVRIDHTLEFINAFQVRITPAVADGRTLVIYRDSSNGGLPRANFTDGGGITESTLDLMAKQSVFVSEEVRDFIGITTEADLASALLATSNNAAAAAASAASADVSADQAEVANAASAINVSLAEGYKTAAELAAANAAAPAVALEAALASTSVGNGASKIGVQDSAGWFSAVVTKTVESVLAWIGSWLWGRDINVFEYLSTAQIASVKAYNFSVDCTAEIQAAMDAAWAQNRDLYLPAGGYKIDAASLVLPGNYPTIDERDKKFRMYGFGYGNPFSRDNTAGTVLKSVSDRPILTTVAIAALPQAHGTFEIDHLRFDGTSTTPVVKLYTTYGNDEYHHFSIYQRGTGDGFYIGYSATASVHDCYFFNRDFVTATLGAARTGVGLNFPQGYGAGLLTITKCSSRGWRDGYIIGLDSGVNVIAYSMAITHCEASTVYNGITFGVMSTACAALENYMEGLDGGTGITDKGEANSIVHNELLGAPAIGIDLQNAARGYGTTCERNEISLGSRDDVIGIKINNGIGGLGRSVTNNFMLWGKSGILNPATGVLYSNVVGIQVSGTNAQIDLGGNMFSPKIAWSGLGTTAQIEDLTTSSLSAGSGQYGFGTASFSNLQIPMLNQGGISLARDGTAINAVTAGVCTLSRASSHTITFPGAVSITSFTAPNIEGKFFVVRVTNGNCTFTNGASLKMAGAANYTPGAGGAMVTFLMHSNVAYEVCRTAY